jgi:hypothetical protein
MIGTGETTSTIAATAVAFTVVVDGPRNRTREVSTVRLTVTWISATGSVGDRVTPGADPGNVTATVSAVVPPNPFFSA